MPSHDQIDEMLAALREHWLSNPDYRLGQLIVNAANPKTPCPGIYYLDDDELMTRLKSLSPASGSSDL